MCVQPDHERQTGQLHSYIVLYISALCTLDLSIETCTLEVSLDGKWLVIPHTTSCEGCNVFDQAVSQAVNPFVSTTVLKLLHRIS